MEIDVPALKPEYAYKLLVGSVQPRPIAWVSTIAAEGDVNLAPFSFFTVASRNPATVLISVSQRPDGSRKDTVKNIEDTGEFTVNIASRRHAEAVTLSSADLPPQVDEFERAGMTPSPSARIRPPRVAEAPISLECVLAQQISLGTDTLLLGTVVWAHVIDGVLDARFRADTAALDPLGRLAGPWFTGEVARGSFSQSEVAGV